MRFKVRTGRGLGLNCWRSGRVELPLKHGLTVFAIGIACPACESITGCSGSLNLSVSASPLRSTV